MSAAPVLDDRLTAALGTRLDRLARAEQRKLGFPGWSTPLPEELVPFLSYELNNYGDPAVDPVFPWHTKDLERELVDELADLFGAPPRQCWGYVTAGGSDGVLAGLWLARQRLPQARVYHSTAAHPSVRRAAELLRMPAVAVPAQPSGELDYDELYRRCTADPELPAAVVATIGTTLSEAVDQVPRIRAVLREAGVAGRYVHSDAALAGVPLALTAESRPDFGLGADGSDSLSISGHKFFGTPFPCGVLLSCTGNRAAAVDDQLICGAPDTMSSSRNGHATLLLWYQLRRRGLAGLRAQAQRSRSVAEYAEQRLSHIGWPAWRSHRYAMTVVLRCPPQAVLNQWHLPRIGGLSHIVCTPGVTHARIDQFVAAVHAAAARKGRPGHVTTDDLQCGGPDLQPIAAAELHPGGVDGSGPAG
ncbi:pyridoxal-dependent decarboxylase [Micromonospora sp. LOL_023]|uniref:pyridoxal-dependent decarboxylase n=1 Tax=Micromonospora sp. LOL_023 TaxID=3345418 RepID=UPI003A872D3D